MNTYYSSEFWAVFYQYQLGRNFLRQDDHKLRIELFPDSLSG